MSFLLIISLDFSGFDEDSSFQILETLSTFAKSSLFQIILNKLTKKEQRNKDQEMEIVLLELKLFE